MDLNEAMIGDLIRDYGPLTEHVAAAVRAIPRELFVPDGYFMTVAGSMPTAFRPVMPEDDDWREQCYARVPLVTQIAGTINPRDVHGEIVREPTSSMSDPSLVTLTLEEADLRPGLRVLELGAGTGWQAALLSRIVGEDNVVTVETDPTIARRAQIHLYGAGHHPEIIEGDGRAGYPAGGPYDRILATFGVARIYPAWLEQVKPGGIIMANLRGRLEPSGLVRLVRQDDGTAVGGFISESSYMQARQEAPSAHLMLPDPSTGRTRPTSLDPKTLHDNAARLVTESVAGGLQWLAGLDVGDGPADWFVDTDTGAYAVVRETVHGFSVTEDPAHPVWGAIETALAAWRDAGEPETTRLFVTASVDGHTIHFP
ncbi:protein-L-isoaspartate(D-aspartate) O-methyltransferase [Yinghuangia sp. ASG 101]|uniref:rRNA adenine N-6-methyltransferase family protein n=1 Tax=Yinghuangia sp. ASG 101 TaxID=2896848 RepID=UPI001E48C794|nr:rRNA adenine N-6-methyltransferase family protein [Yinghuangia sp. ASG 101]UGQ14748.1 protein-L-isoaspartate(D-aspartate) O-methyltransferase [Yinghuangia sp. ASG 101]